MRLKQKIRDHIFYLKSTKCNIKGQLLVPVTLDFDSKLKQTVSSSPEVAVKPMMMLSIVVMGGTHSSCVRVKHEEN